MVRSLSWGREKLLGALNSTANGGIIDERCAGDKTWVSGLNSHQRRIAGQPLDHPDGTPSPAIDNGTGESNSATTAAPPAAAKTLRPEGTKYFGCHSAHLSGHASMRMR
jgi:hypothetical protein